MIITNKSANANEKIYLKFVVDFLIFVHRYIHSNVVAISHAIYNVISNIIVFSSYA